MKIITKNKNLRNYERASEFIEAGIILKGSEIKSIRSNGMELKNAYITFTDNEAFLIGSHISPYKWATIEQHDPDAKRKLLLNKREILRMQHQRKTQGVTYIAASAYLTNKNILKISIAVVKGVKKKDKRQIEKNKEHKKELKKYV